MKNIAIKMVRIYKKIDYFLWSTNPLGLAASGCKFYPTCSEYTAEAIKKDGFLKGLIRGGYRILRCNPLSKGGVDLV